ncbi:phosphoribosylformylglycinamidine synthase subunit PurL [Chloracidobacterium thermophilum]|uniref:Phosphoribosylformylglycinamidine synthase subunit PurL n=1 Tax=Chloracidobacterium thermophilum (strain B) TaxID=981222 RepID=G2LF46_CHLTF|nr:phosphoribosylformylglycinamidine synthase subunit PurL [Chloracidobacterium thermophilum]AEP12974.1 phosphoribosylformylglycinamidine synthase subunit II [Chloracidobacterium thermophilum B]QUV78691.1 phosphoribosylformylglycinamidine synthase subunit PurL [Chloracidobacterium thermophilum]
MASAPEATATLVVTPELLAVHRLTSEEYARLCQLLGRTPTLVELGIFSVMWSEHCSYKSSRTYLKTLPTTGPRVVQGPGENAGILDIGEGWCIAFKIESHNHPSFIEPFQGAATGVGGILRDVFTMGARPVALLNSLRFGPLDAPHHGPRNRALLDGVVRGIAHYGNAFGCPTIGGEVYFEDCYSLNPLVNAFALGLVRRDQIFLGKAAGIGNPVMYVGAKTGRDGIHGATMASAEFDDNALAKRPTVQVGDPFCEKLLLEACLEAMRAGCIVGIQDMGAAGLTSSSCEMGARAGTGIDLELSHVPQRETGMTPYEIMLSESQERMLLVADSGREREVQEIFTKWGLSAVVIGRVTDTQRLRVYHHGQIVADIPNRFLTDDAPRYERPAAPPAGWVADAADRRARQEKELAQVFPTTERHLSAAQIQADLRQLLSSPNIASRQWIYRQYDHMVRTNTIVLPGADAAVIRIKETRKAVAMTLDGNGRYVAIEPRQGAALAVAEACRNLVAVGAEPIGLTNCLNFASPERPEVMWQLREAIAGMGEAAEFFATPIVSGNVSLYNETEGRGVFPTPVIGAVGLIEDVRLVITPRTLDEGAAVYVLGATGEDLGGTEYLRRRFGVITGPLPVLNLDAERRLQHCVLEGVQQRLWAAAHDCSDGGLLVALAELCFSTHGKALSGMDLCLSAEAPGLSRAGLLFGETPGRMLIVVAPSRCAEAEALCQKHQVPCHSLGIVRGNRFTVTLDGELALDEPVAELEHLWRTALCL